MPNIAALLKQEITRLARREVRAQVQASHPELKIEAGDIARWGYERMSAGRMREAVPLMRLAVELEPSGSTYMGLGESYERAGEKARAIEAYREALKHDAGNIIVKQRLEELATPSAAQKPH